MYLLDKARTTSKRFTAEITISKGESVSMVKGRATAMAHILHVRRTAQFIDIVRAQTSEMATHDECVLRVGDRALAHFAFCNGEEYVRPGQRVLLRGGLMRAHVGFIKKVR